MPKSKTPEKIRIPNEERSARTREKLIQATIDCLYEVGYHQTTTTLVAARAGVSRGAMLHQFANKAELILATGERISQLRGELHKARLEVLETSEERFYALIDVLWEAMLSPSGLARIELMLSSRSDDDLADHFQEMDNFLDSAHKERIWTLAQMLGVSDKHEATIKAFVQLYAAALRGLAIDSIRPNAREGTDLAVELLKTFQRDLFQTLLKDGD